MARKKQKPIQTQKGQDIPELSEAQAREHLEKLRWPNGPICIKCGSDQCYKLNGETTRYGLIKCRACKDQFTVTVGTIFEDSHLPLAKWVKGFHLMVSSKKGVSALQLMRNLGLGSYRTAWHSAHRIRYAMSNPQKGFLKGQVQADETYMGGKPRPGDGKEHKRGRGTSKTPVVVLVETGGNAVSRPVGDVTAATLRSALEECVDRSATIITDDHSAYPQAVVNFAGHESVNHSAGEYAKQRPVLGGDGVIGRIDTISTNTAESFFALMKRGAYGVYHKMSKQHLHRYCSEFDFRWNGRDLSDSQRRTMALMQVEGKRLMYRQPRGDA